MHRTVRVVNRTLTPPCLPRGLPAYSGRKKPPPPPQPVSESRIQLFQRRAVVVRYAAALGTPFGVRRPPARRAHTCPSWGHGQGPAPPRLTRLWAHGRPLTYFRTQPPSPPPLFLGSVSLSLGIRNVGVPGPPTGAPRPAPPRPHLNRWAAYLPGWDDELPEYSPD